MVLPNLSEMIDNMNPTSKFTGISWKFLKLLIPVITLAAVLVLASYTYWKFKSAEVALTEKIETIADVHSDAVAHPLWTVDTDGITRSIQTLALYPEIDCVEVVELSQNRSYQSPVDCKGSIEVEKIEVEKMLSKALLSGPQKIGQLDLYYSVDPLLDSLKQEVLVSALFFLLLVCVGGVVAYAAMQLIVQRPVRRLINSIETFENDGVRESVDWSSQDELGSVIKSYNSMIRQVEDNTNELIAAREQAESAAHTKSRFLANMSHELRTPLNAVIGITEMLREEVSETETEPYDRIAGSGRHLLNLIDEILDFSKLEAGKIRLAIEDVSILELLEDVCATAQPLADNRSNVLIRKYDGEPTTLMTDAFRLRQIMINLLSNACKFTESGKIIVSVYSSPSPSGPGVCFSVSDTGIGIPKDRMDQLFEEFSQADTSTTREYGGTGLGLAISDKLCKLLGGEITVKSTPGEGSEFSFTLPVEAQMGSSSAMSLQSIADAKSIG